MSEQPAVLPLDHGGPVSRPFEQFPPGTEDGTVVDRLDAIVARYAARPAIADASGVTTYGELGAQVDSVAEATVHVTTGRPGPVAVVGRHDARFPGAVLGILAAGRGCIPLDASHPIERNRLIAAHADAAAVAVTDGSSSRARDLFPGIPVLDLNNLASAEGRRVREQCGPDAVACVIYTSGSTGTPKGVYQNHRGVLHDVMESVHTAHIGSDDRLALFYSPCVIAGWRVMLSALLSGAQLHVLEPVALGASGLTSAIRTHALTVLRSSPTLFRHVAGALEPGERFESVRLVQLGGERIDWSDVDVFKRACVPGALLGVHLGATECWTIHTHWFVDEGIRAGSERLPVGRSVLDRTVSILDEDGRPVADDEAGECVVTSRYLARGYWKDPGLTARTFASDTADSEAYVYRTGDLVVRRRDGLLEHVGRRDHQIKLGGRRVEPGEIEAALRQCTGIADAAVVARRAPSGDVRALTAYVETRPEAGGLLPRHVKALLSQRVPRHMVPAKAVILDRLPRLVTFKIDRARLQEIDATPQGDPVERGDDPLLDAVATVFEQVLQVEGSTADDSLLSLGADSLQTITVAAKLETRFGIRVPLDTFEAAESIREVARWIEAARRSPGVALPSASRSEKVEDVPPIARRESRLTARRASRQPSPAGPTDMAAWAATVEGLFEAGDLQGAVQTLQAVFPDVTKSSSRSGRRLLEIVRQIPASAGGPIAFDEDPNREVQIVERPDAAAAIVLFCGNRRGLGVPIRVIHQWFGRLPATLIYLRDLRREHYFSGLRTFGPDRDATLASLRAIVGSRRTICVGTSSGAVAALHFGLDLGAESAIVFAGPLNFSQEFNLYLRTAWLASRLRRTVPAALLDVRRHYADAPKPPRALLVYGDNCWDDRLHAEYMSGLPGVRLLPVGDNREHNVVTEVIARGWFDRVIDWAWSRTDDLPAVIPVGAAPAHPSALGASA
jgi:amino acid adenylation domain-containing protein